MFRRIPIKLIFHNIFYLYPMHLKRRYGWRPDVSDVNVLNDYMWQRHLAEKNRFNCAL